VQVSDLKSLALIPSEAKRAIDSFLGERSSSIPETHAYEFQSHHIVDMLEKLLDKFIAERTKREQTETLGLQAYEVLIQDLTAETGNAKDTIKDKVGIKADTLQKKSNRRRRSG